MKRAIVLADWSLSSWRRPDSPVFEILVIYVLPALLIVLVFIWAIFWRRPGGRHHPSHHGRKSVHKLHVALPQREKRSHSPLGLLRHKRHRRRQRPMNPTLAQAGKLPPRRSDQSPAN